MKHHTKGSATTILLVVIIIILAIFGGYMYAQNKNLTSSVKPEVSVSPTPSSGAVNRDQKVMTVARQVLATLAARNYTQLEDLVSPNGLSLSAYPNLTLTKSDVAQKDVSEIPKNTKVYFWGYTDGKGDPINLTIADFVNKYIYTHDYQKAPNIGVNKKIGQGNSTNSIDTDSAGRVFVAFNFAGFDERYSGMDWTTIYLVFDQVGDEYKLRAIAKDNWTI